MIYFMEKSIVYTLQQNDIYNLQECDSNFNFQEITCASRHGVYWYKRFEDILIIMIN